MPETLRILLVDDEPFFRSVLGAYLKKLDYEVEEASNAEEAFARIKNFDPNVVLLDIMMPGTSGTEMVETLKDWKPECEVIMITGAPSEEAKKECIAKGAFTVISKPVELEDVKSIVLKAVAKHQGNP